MLAYPFLWSKNDRGLGWTAVVSPTLIADREARKILRQAQRGDEFEQDEALYVQCNHSQFGILDILFRAGAQYVDDDGREFNVCEGFVLQGRSENFQFFREHLDAARDAMASKFDDFWGATEWADDRAQSELSIDLTTVTGGTPLKVRVEAVDFKIRDNDRSRKQIERRNAENREAKEASREDPFLPTSSPLSKSWEEKSEKRWRQEKKSGMPPSNNGEIEHSRSAPLLLTGGVVLTFAVFFATRPIGVFLGIAGVGLLGAGILSLAQTKAK